MCVFVCVRACVSELCWEPIVIKRFSFKRWLSLEDFIYLIILFTCMPGDSYRKQFRSLLLRHLLYVWRLSNALDSVCCWFFFFYSLACLTCCCKSYRPNFYLHSSFSFIFLILSLFSLQLGAADAKTEVSSTLPVFLKVLSIFGDDIPSINFIHFIFTRMQGLWFCIPCYVCDVCRVINHFSTESWQFFWKFDETIG